MKLPREKYDPSVLQWVTPEMEDVDGMGPAASTPITKAPTAPIERPTKDMPQRASLLPEGEFYKVNLNRWYDVPMEYAAIIWRVTKQIPTFVWGIINIWIGIKMTKNQRIAAGIASVIVGLAAIFGFDLSAEITTAITSVVALIVGLLIPTGTTKPE